MINHMWINGELVESAGQQRFEVVNPATEVITTVSADRGCQSK